VYGICYYYEIHSAKFIGCEKPASEPALEVIKPKSKTTERAEAIRAYKAEHPDISRAELAVLFEVSEKTIQRLHIFWEVTHKV
jgi:predicted HTH transcriptional regulator